MTKKETKDSDLPCHTTKGRGWGWGGEAWGGGLGVVGGEVGELDETVVPQLAPLCAATVRDRTVFQTTGRVGFVGLFIWHYY
jgi:hypothetical protein